MLQFCFGRQGRLGRRRYRFRPPLFAFSLLAVLLPQGVWAAPTRTIPPTNTVEPTRTTKPTRTPPGGGPTATVPPASDTNTPEKTPTITPIQPTSTRTHRGAVPTATLTETPGDPAPTETLEPGGDTPTATRTRFVVPTRTRTPGPEGTATLAETPGDPTPTETLEPGGDTPTETRTRFVVPTRTRTPGPAGTATPPPTTGPRTSTPRPEATNTVPRGTKTPKPTSTPRPVLPVDISFRSGREFKTGEGPTSLAAADFNRDGLSDVALVSRANDTLTILLGLSPNALQAGPDAPATGREPVGVIALPLDDNISVDLVTAEATDGTVSTYLNNGDGAFSVGQRLSITGEPSALAVFGSRIAVADRLNSRVVLLRRNAAGGLVIDGQVATGVEPIALAVGDVNQDKRLDLVTADDVGESVTVLLDNGNGSFDVRSVSVSGVPGALTLGDYDVDGFLDFAVTLPLTNTVAVYHQENGGFIRSFEAEVSSPSAILMADDQSIRITGDTFPDLLVLSADAALLTLFEGQVPETVPPFELVSRFTVGDGPVGLMTANIDNDPEDFADLIIANSRGDSAQIVRGAGDGSFVAPVTFVTDLGPAAVVIGDYDQDRKGDIVTANLNAGTVSFLKGNGLGGVRSRKDTQVLVAPSLMITADFTGDGQLDLALASTINSNGAIYRSNGDGTFSATRELNLAGAPAGLGAADFDADGHLDLAVAWSSGEVFGVDLFADLNSSSFPRFELLATGIPTDVGFADVNGDGTIDVVALVPDRQELNVWYQLQDGRFFDPTTFSTGVHPTHFVLADIDEDGQMDVITVNHEAFNMGLIFGDRGGFLSPSFIALPDQPSAIVAGDFNLDGSVDLAVVSDISGRVTVFAGDGNGTFPRVSRFASGVEPQALAVGQVNNDETRGDAKADLVVADYPSDRVTILRNTTDIPRVEPTARPTSTPRTLASSGGGGCSLPGSSDGTLLLFVGVAVVLALGRAYAAEGGRRA